MQESTDEAKVRELVRQMYSTPEGRRVLEQLAGHAPGVPTAEDMRAADEAAVKAIRERFPDAPTGETGWDTPIRPAGDR